ncbi:glycosyltransferase family 1 protein [Methylomonas sp. LL1]|uniref:glycosyltransferase family protein n=1 Tax=Methylomonas sp. LL1 TaxID=2785785 RepID=UPI0018C4150B|nr:glycosyltransferase [Methylomonas sp. LL1]QPK62110.1 glycosyltransferase family 1 protein [Methylomonas sp. LL1]
MRIFIDFRKPFVALEQALFVEGCEIVRDYNWEQFGLEGFDACLVDFCDSARHIKRLWQMNRYSRKSGTILIGIDRDAPWHKGVKRHKLWLMSKLKLLDIYASHSIQESNRFAQSLYLPNAAWIEKYHLYGRTLESLRYSGGYIYDVSFIGNINADRYPEHRKRLDFLNQLKAKLHVFGVNIAIFESENMKVKDQVEIIQHSRINLNYSAAADNNGEISWGLPERCYGIPSCGGFLLSDRRQHAALDFDLNTQWIDFGDMDECVSKIRHYLSHFDQARVVAEAAYNRVISDHTYSNRARSLLNAIGALEKHGI